MSEAQILENIQKELERKVFSINEDDLLVCNIRGKGRGVRTARQFLRGEFLVEYKGALITLGSAKEREQEYSRCASYGCFMYYFKYEGINYCIDSTNESIFKGRLINHSRWGNCEPRLLTVAKYPAIILQATRDIDKGEELLYDYGDRSKAALEAHPWLKL